MKKILVPLVLVLSVVSAFAQSTAIEGNWGIQQQSGAFTFDMTFSISKNLITVTNVCSKSGQITTAKVTAQSTYTGNTLTILEAKQDQKSENGLDCNVGVQQDTLGYSIQGNQLNLTHVGSPESMILHRK